jgi:hypothetical protein
LEVFWVVKRRDDWQLPKKTVPGLIDHKDEDTAIFLNAGNHLPHGTA